MMLENMKMEHRNTLRSVAFVNLACTINEKVIQEIFTLQSNKTLKNFTKIELSLNMEFDACKLRS